jgi:DNA polymerase-3 subunit epsilon
MKNILILDTETTGLDPKDGKMIEVAAIFYNVASQTITHQVSTLIHSENNAAFDINRISPNALQSVLIENQKAALKLIHYMLLMCDAVVAHNAPFDRGWIESFDSSFSEISKQKEWLCTKEDFTWPVRKGIPLNLIHIAVDLEVPVISAHRALSDCLLLAGCFSKLNDLPDRLIQARLPKENYVAVVSFDDRQLAKDAGFSWDAATKQWERRMTAELAATLPFKVTINKHK